ncbi:hypothetical protein EDD16DRAFT_1515303 [Pisolithus croceorrhizus]|nr:hypothetical protein EV401DRAFT_1893618 [Pisolithus croceorrhizus]KAI6131140.1 hypothetical protein EDD16DRAFT_1515303 [Pisolithus croceorrhizus]KAI6159878.1 hypothetical protein EDD17DRAFT_1510980 [Pisolithus thermaeus]
MPLAVHQDNNLSDDDLNPGNVSSDGRDSDSSNNTSDLDKMRNVLQVPGPSAEAHKLHKALAIAQKAYADAHIELCSIQKELAVLSSAIPACKCNCILNKTETLDSSIAKEAKKYVMLYHFWVADGVFPTTFKPDVNPCSPSCWNLPKAKVKDSTSLIFAQYNLDPSILATQDPSKQTDPKFQLLLMKDDKYTQLAPILFKNHEVLVPDGFLKSPIIVSIIHVLIFGKASLSNQTWGQPKARGQHLELTSVTKGLVAGAATLACFLLLADPELGAVGAMMGIPYHDDFDFYLQHLFKCSTWAIDVMDNTNQEVFGTKSKLISKDLPDVVSNLPAHTWEDNFLDEMENDTIASASMPLTNTMNLSHSPSPPLVSTLSILPSPLSDDTATNVSASVTQTQGNPVTVSAVSQLQVKPWLWATVTPDLGESHLFQPILPIPHLPTLCSPSLQSG